MRLIRGNDLYQYPPNACGGSSRLESVENARRLALYVVDNDITFDDLGLKEIWMPLLTGNVIGCQFVNISVGCSVADIPICKVLMYKISFYVVVVWYCRSEAILTMF